MTHHSSVVSLILRLQDMGCKIWAEDDKLRIRGGKDTLTTELKQEIQTHKTDILAFLSSTKAPAIVPTDIPKLGADTPKSLSFAQQRLWLLAQLQGASDSYGMPMVLQLTGALNIEALRASLVYLIDRHSSLRMSFPTVAGHPQVIVREINGSKMKSSEINASEIDASQIDASQIDASQILVIHDWRDRNEHYQSQTVRTFVDICVQEPFNLSTGPLFKATLLQLSASNHVLIINMHHIVSDGWSIGILTRELRQVYTVFDQGQSPHLPPLPIQYSDYATWQRHWLQGEVLATQMAYWQQQLDNAPRLLELPTDHPRPAQPSYRGHHYQQVLSPDLTAAIKHLSQQHSVSLFMTLLAAFSVLLARYSRQTDLCLGSPIANRTHTQTEGLIGFFVNTLVLRQQLQPGQSFIELLRQTRQTCLDAYAHQDVPFEYLVEHLQPERSLSHNPYFQVMFTLENHESIDLSLPNLEIDWFPLTYPFAKFDLALLALESDQQLNLTWEFALDLFNPDTIERMAAHFEVLLQDIIDNPQQPIETLSLLTVTERQQLQNWNKTETDYPHDKTLVDLIEQQVEQQPNALALVFESKSLTYQQLNQKANQLANYLIQHYAIQPDTLIGICIERSLEMVIGFLGVLKAGGVYMPIDPDYPSDRIEFMLQDAGISVLLTQRSLKPTLPIDQVESLQAVICLDEEPFNAPLETALASLNAVFQSRCRPQDLAYVIYTSGSTGRPKGVMIEHGGLTNVALTCVQQLQVQPQSHVLQLASCSFDMAIAEITSALVAGACLYLAQPAALFPGPDLTHFLREHQISHLIIPPSVLAALPDATLPDLQTISVGGEACLAKLVTQWAPNRRFLNAYGPTEATMCVTMAVCLTDGKKPSIGSPLPNLRIYILDEHHQPVPPGVPGELCIAGVGLARGYLNRPEITAERFIEVELFERSERIYKTGDLARWLSDGNLDYLGRLDTQIKLRGLRIELSEIEAVLLQYSAVQEAIVTVVQTDMSTGSQQRLVAYITRAKGANSPNTDITTSPDHAINLPDDLRRYLRSRLPDYMVPTQIMVLDRLPLTSNGKLDRTALPPPDQEIESAHTAPRNALEHQLAQIWATTLERQQVGIHDNFFDLGGHSLLAMQLISQIQQAFGQPLSLNSLFEHPTISQLAQQLAQHPDPRSGHPEYQPASADLLPLQPQGKATPIFCLPGANGLGFYFRDLALALGQNQPLYSLETPGRDGTIPLPDSVAAHASQLIQPLHQQQPTGPYILVGYSSGCAVAFELAYQLEQLGETVGLLAILDAGLVSQPESITQRTDLDWIWQLLQRIEALKNVSLGLTYEDLANQPDDHTRWNLAAESLYRQHVLPEYASLALLKINLNVMKTLTLNYAHYQPDYAIAAPILLFRAQAIHDIVRQEVQAISNYDRPDWQWQAYTQNSVRVVSVPGNHGQMLYEPNVQHLARHLQTAIQTH